MSINIQQEPTLEEDYNEEEDDDFNPEGQPAGQLESSSDESEPEQKYGTNNKIKTKRKLQKEQHAEGEDQDLDFENSGDEGIIKEGTKQERKRKRKRNADEEDGGEGGFVLTRSMRAAADPAIAKVSGALSGKVTADIHAIWARLQSGSIAPSNVKPEEEGTITEKEDMVTIQRTYTFAGKIHTETKVVPRSSAQAQAYLATKDDRTQAHKAQSEKPRAEYMKGPEGQALSQPKRRISAWEPNPTGFVKGMPSAPTVERTKTTIGALKVVDKIHLGSDASLWHRATPELIIQAGRAVLKSGQGPAPLSNLAKQMKAQKLNVVDKSKLDWAEHVDATGTREELEKAKKDKTSYLERKDFLDRVENKAEDDRAKARGAVK